MAKPVALFMESSALRLGTMSQPPIGTKARPNKTMDRPSATWQTCTRKEARLFRGTARGLSSG